MRHKTMMLGAAAVAAACLSACGDHGGGSVATPTMPTTQQLDTAGVLALAQKSSEVSEPFAINDNALVITDTSDTAEPISVNGM